MRVEVRLYATFAQYAPTQRAGDSFYVHLEPGSSLDDVISELAIPEGEVHLVIVNGRPLHDHSKSLQEDDRVALFPPVGGG
ncbi:MoaD/ThiS family protein [Candidatus Bipolaricaulota bacterium]|nr:MoaD/ThiS family protein [Candidatus Bipolaricaulota bacterium]